MSVYSKCAGTDCARKSLCLRFTVPPLAKYQPWLVQIVSVPDTKACKFFTDNGEKQMKWFSIKEDGIPDWCGDYLVHYLCEGWPEIKVASISDTQFFDEDGEFLDVTHWAKLEYPKISDDIPH